ncbi:hypothetical protein BOX15_Mlig025672g3, partial [Macrostomum lignano]
IDPTTSARNSDSAADDTGQPVLPESAPTVSDVDSGTLVVAQCSAVKSSATASCALLPLLSRLSSLSIVPAGNQDADEEPHSTRMSRQTNLSSDSLAQLCRRYALAARRESAAAVTVAAFCSRRQQQHPVAADPLRRISKPSRLLRRPSRRKLQQQQHRLHCQLSRNPSCTILVSTTAIAELLLSNQHLAQLSSAWMRDRNIRLFGLDKPTTAARLALEAPPAALAAAPSEPASASDSSVSTAASDSTAEPASLLASAGVGEASTYSTERCRLVGDAYPDLTVYELASYFDELVRLPKKMSSQAESMYL